jgi:hydroxymethylpyrimidine/phosphomethylpyrimidine kinase
VDHLLATSASGSYAVLLAAILPCYWLYAEVGRQLHAAYLDAGAPGDHPYADWLKTYADEEFAAATRKAIDLTDAAALRASSQEREAMVEAFAHSCRYETAFFDAPRLFA